MGKKQIRFDDGTGYTMWFDVDDLRIKEICLKANFKSIEIVEEMTKDQYLKLLETYNK